MNSFLHEPPNEEDDAPFDVEDSILTSPYFLGDDEVDIEPKRGRSHILNDEGELIPLGEDESAVLPEEEHNKDVKSE